jgi:hypothetical protein
MLSFGVLSSTLSKALPAPSFNEAAPTPSSYVIAGLSRAEPNRAGGLILATVKYHNWLEEDAFAAEFRQQGIKPLMPRKS